MSREQKTHHFAIECQKKICFHHYCTHKIQSNSLFGLRGVFHSVIFRIARIREDLRSKELTLRAKEKECYNQECFGQFISFNISSSMCQCLPHIMRNLSSGKNHKFFIWFVRPEKNKKKICQPTDRKEKKNSASEWIENDKKPMCENQNGKGEKSSTQIWNTNARPAWEWISNSNSLSLSPSILAKEQNACPKFIGQ